MRQKDIDTMEIMEAYDRWEERSRRKRFLAKMEHKLRNKELRSGSY